MPFLYFALFVSLEHGGGVADVKALSKKVAPKSKVEELPPIAGHTLPRIDNSKRSVFCFSNLSSNTMYHTGAKFIA